MKNAELSMGLRQRLEAVGVSFGRRRSFLLLACVGVSLLSLLGFFAAMGLSPAPKTEPNLRLVVIPRFEPSAPKASLAKFEPKKGCYLGAYIELDPKLKKIYMDRTNSPRKLPEEFESYVRKPHAMYFFYLGYGHPLPTDWVSYLDMQQKFVHVALEPNNGLDRVKDDAYLRKLADDMHASGARIFLRFASEMNGEWVRYNGNPRKYRDKFRLVTKIMRERAPNVAMVWCPYTTPQRSISWYYPGDDAVDWVGVNMYNVTFFDQNPRRPASHVAPTDMLNFVYRKYSARKPIMICEYGTTHFSAVENKPVVEYARRNIRQLYGALPERYPRVKCINYFNTNNLLLKHARNNNYSLTGDPHVLATYRQAISSDYYLSKYDLAGSDPEPAGDTQLANNSLIDQPTRLGARVRSPYPDPTVRYYIDGELIHESLNDNDRDFILQPRSFRSGRRILKTVAIGRRGETVAENSISIIVRN